MEIEWAELVEQATGWQHQLEEAEAGLSRLEAELNGLDSKLEGLEAESTAWCLPPSLDSAKAELEELETAMVGLQELQEQVTNIKTISKSKSKNQTQNDDTKKGGHNPGDLKQITASSGQRFQSVRGGEKTVCTSRCCSCQAITIGCASGIFKCKVDFKRIYGQN